MDRSLRLSGKPASSVPRTRGDGPLNRPQVNLIFQVFPAHAGMDRRHWGGRPGTWRCSPHTRGWTGERCCAEARRLGVPRTRGDGPKWLGMPDRPAEVFPAHAGMDRPLAPDPQHPGSVFPAHAGMDRSRVGRGQRGLASVPRTRGDGPVGDYWRQQQAECSPHTRGWTECGTLERWIEESVPRTRGDGP